MEPEGSLPHSQDPATCPYPELDRSSPYPHIPLPEWHLNIILPSTPGSPKWSLSLSFPHQNPVYASPLPHFALHAPPISFFSMLSPQQYWVSSTVDPFSMHIILSLLRIWRYLPGSVTDGQTTGLAFTARCHFIVRPMNVTRLPNCVS